jgi:error-prone DNA polymerase
MPPLDFEHVMGGWVLRITGHVQREAIVMHLITQPQTDDAPRGRPQPRATHPRDQAKRLVPSRDFH